MARILVIDDDEIMNDMVVQMLKEAGYKVKGATDGRKGLKLLDAQPFDLIVTDIVMPEVEGLEMIQVIRTINKTIPIIAISGGGRVGPENYLDAAKLLGANFTFQKPFDKTPFLTAVKACLANVHDE
jgi:DNA-binding response OmpR family regulator